MYEKKVTQEILKKKKNKRKIYNNGIFYTVVLVKKNKLWNWCLFHAQNIIT